MRRIRMEIKAIMCDVDGTILNRQGVVSPRTIEAIRKIKEKGMLFGLCTGRDVHSVKDLLEEWGIAGLVDAVVGTGGAEIADFTLNIEKSSYPLAGELIREIMAHFEDMDVNFAIPCEGLLYAPKEDDYIRHLARVDKIPYRIVDFNEFLKEPKPKLMIICNPDKMNEVVERSKTFTNSQYKSAALITASILFEYMDPRISKTHGLQ